MQENRCNGEVWDTFGVSASSELGPRTQLTSGASPPPQPQGAQSCSSLLRDRWTPTSSGSRGTTMGLLGLFRLAGRPCRFDSTEFPFNLSQWPHVACAYT